MARREQYDDDMMDAEQPQRVRSTVSSVRKQKGRGFRERMETDDTRNGARGSYDTLEAGSGPGPAKCDFFLLAPNFSSSNSRDSLVVHLRFRGLLQLHRHRARLGV